MTAHAWPAPPLGARICTCPCGKWYSPTKNDARALRREIEQFTGQTSQVRFYECEHGGHHWTQMIAPPPTVNKPAKRA